MNHVVAGKVSWLLYHTCPQLARTTIAASHQQVTEKFVVLDVLLDLFQIYVGETAHSIQEKSLEH